MAGSGSNLALVRALAARFEERTPGARVHVPESIGTGGAVKALSDGAIDLGLGSRPLKEAERQRGLSEVRLCRTALVPVVNPAADVDALSHEDLAAIYRGERATWPNGVPIVPLLREPGDSGNDLLIRTYPALGVALKAALRTELWQVAYTDQEMRDSLHSIPGSIGFLDLSTIRLEGLPLTPVRLDGAVAPVSGSGGGYPLVKELTFLLRGPPSAEAQAFLDFALSPEAAELLARAGCLEPPP